MIEDGLSRAEIAEYLGINIGKGTYNVSKTYFFQYSFKIRVDNDRIKSERPEEVD